jgi:hypothetical protein
MKEILISIKPIKSNAHHRDIQTIVLHESKKIINPEKIFFPYDIKSENCWWPMTQDEVVIEEIIHNPTNHHNDFIILYNFDTSPYYISEIPNLEQRLEENLEEEEKEHPF